eukprot:TRINITY_DN4309_c0_g1_i2.p1 TRINITY_DN4309_c0_g1~~TRINITY_DN4309_c0_g1_i2.p1  ORF type:complete len:320 (-),score=46.40 TRINITY_DN4309_c0_g1_i2:33-992(-)
MGPEKKDEEVLNEKEKDKKKKKKKSKKTKKRDRDDKSDESDEEVIDPGTKKKLKTSSIKENPNIPEDLKEKYSEIEQNPLKLIVANIPHGITKDELSSYFTTLLITLKPSLRSITPIAAIEIGDTKNFAVFELVNKDVKQLCLSLENLEYQGYKLQVRKPKGFFDQLYDPETQKKLDPFGNIITTVTDVDNKIYMGGLPLYLKDEDVKKLCESFGMLKYFNLVKDSSTGQPQSKGYCFFEYLDPKVTDKAIKARIYWKQATCNSTRGQGSPFQCYRFILGIVLADLKSVCPGDDTYPSSKCYSQQSYSIAQHGIARGSS